jgi:alpha-glucosidase
LTTGGSEFLFGSRILVAPNPSPEEIAPYNVYLPPGTWYDYWSGEQFTRGEPSGTLDLEQRDKLAAQQPLLITPKLDRLPVYVRGGSILPIAPLTQSTADIPNGPLTLRVFPLAVGLNTPGEACAGEVYADDGHSFDFRNGAFARVRFACSVAPDGAVVVEIGSQEGRWKPWWHEYRVEVAGWTPKENRAFVEGKKVALTQSEGRWGTTVPANTQGIRVELQ